METRVDKCSGEEHRDTRCMSRGAQASSVTCSKVQARYCLGIRSKNPRRPEGRGGMIKLQPPKGEIGRAHVRTSVTDQTRKSSSAWKKKRTKHSRLLSS